VQGGGSLRCAHAWLCAGLWATVSGHAVWRQQGCVPLCVCVLGGGAGLRAKVPGLHGRKAGSATACRPSPQPASRPVS
jgi:hypothetical protein